MCLILSQLFLGFIRMGFDPGVFGRFDLAALVQPHLQLFLFVCLSGAGWWCGIHCHYYR